MTSNDAFDVISGETSCPARRAEDYNTLLVANLPEIFPPIRNERGRELARSARVLRGNERDGRPTQTSDHGRSNS